MESLEPIKQAAQQCIEGFLQCLDTPVLMENEWAENRLADMNLWISGTGACARGRASLDSRLASKPEACDVIVNLLHLLGAIIEECRMQSQVPESHSDLDEENPDHPEYEGQDRAFSPWSEDSSSDIQSEDAHATRIPSASPLREIMYNIESMQDQLARIAVAVRRSGTRSRLQKADRRFKAAEHQELEGHLVGMLLTQLGYCPKERDSSKLSEVQLRLVRCNLKRRNRFLYSQQHSVGLDAHSVFRGDHKSAPKDAGAAEEQMVGGKPDSSPSKDMPRHANSTVVTGTSASQVSGNIDLSQPGHASVAASSIVSTTAIDLDYPRPPRFRDDAHMFRCPCCREALPVQMANKNRWRKHIADDLSPYTCIAANCDQADVLFNSKQAWREHILKSHSSLTYWTCFACGDGSQFNDKNAFVQHIKSNHAATIPKGQIQVLCDLSQKNTPTGIERCPLCNWPEEDGVEIEKDVLLNHIAREIHSFSLRALPWADDNGQQSDQTISESSNKVYEWLIQNELHESSGPERPSRERRLRYSEYFEQNSYFASSSKASSSSERVSNTTRENELKELRNAGEPIVHGSYNVAELASQVQNSEGDTRPHLHSTPSVPEDYNVGWVCTITTEYVAAQQFLDEKHEAPMSLPLRNMTDYTLGRVGQHNIVIANLPGGSYGTVSGAMVAEDMMRCFPNIRICLMIGIGGGVPSKKHDIRLGDIVIGIPHNAPGAVLQYDFGKALQSQTFQTTGIPGLTPIVLRTGVDELRAKYQSEGNQLHRMVCKILDQKPRLRKKYQRPDLTSDRLYRSEVIHPRDGETTCVLSCGDAPSSLISRPPRTQYDDNPAIHYGIIASGNQLMKDAGVRDKLAADRDILCFEMEVAGLNDNFPCLVIRGICDYADTHKTKHWQGYAAMVAAAYARDLLSHISPWQVEQEARWSNSRNGSISFGRPGHGIKVGEGYAAINWTSVSR